MLQDFGGAEANALAADRNRRQADAEKLLTADATDGMQKLQAGCDLLIAGFRQVRTSTHAARMALPNRPDWWPDLWGNQLEGQMRRYLSARGRPLGGNILQSDHPRILAGPDLVTMHKVAVQEILGSTTTEHAA